MKLLLLIKSWSYFQVSVTSFRKCVRQSDLSQAQPQSGSASVRLSLSLSATPFLVSAATLLSTKKKTLTTKMIRRNWDQEDGNRKRMKWNRHWRWNTEVAIKVKYSLTKTATGRRSAVSAAASAIKGQTWMSEKDKGAAQTGWNVFHSILSRKSCITSHPDGMNSYLENRKSKPKVLKDNINLSIPLMSLKQRETKHDCLDPGTRPGEEAAAQFIHYEPVNGPTNIQWITVLMRMYKLAPGCRISKQYAGNYEKAKWNNS